MPNCVIIIIIISHWKIIELYQIYQLVNLSYGCLIYFCTITPGVVDIMPNFDFKVVRRAVEIMHIFIFSLSSIKGRYG